MVLFWTFGPAQKKHHFRMVNAMPQVIWDIPEMPIIQHPGWFYIQKIFLVLLFGDYDIVIMSHKVISGSLLTMATYLLIMNRN